MRQEQEPDVYETIDGHEIKRILGYDPGIDTTDYKHIGEGYIVEIKGEKNDWQAVIHPKMIRKRKK